ncbi:MAG: bifunctional [glutamate--ammonia ligase]-adenylyl-L-tyrosine phosphorylase/[glutamate--ammonia-ligase] adenylyltransferase [Gammaproteobacteria bacterium]
MPKQPKMETGASVVPSEFDARSAVLLARACGSLTLEAKKFIDERWRTFLHRLAMPTPQQFQQFCDSLPDAVIDEMPRLVACSDFLLSHVTQYPDVFVALAQTGRLHEAELLWDWRAELHQFLGEDWLHLSEEVFDQKLRQFRNRAYVCVVWRDLAGLDNVWRVTESLSVLADAVITVACDYHHHHLSNRFGSPYSRSGVPQGLVVLAMGKLGAYELNLSSDVDLIFVYPELGETKWDEAAQQQKPASCLSNQEFFVRLGQRLINSLSKVTQDGFVFRVDMRLRPFGQSGDLVLHFDAFETYYQEHGRCWERYALIKARPITGDPAAGAHIIERLRPFVYRRYLDYGAIEELRQIKALINREVIRQGGEHNLKTGSGGIREVEFIAQAFQLIRGGQQRVLQQRALRLALQLLCRLHLLPEQVVTALQEAYEFLRRSEHSLQAVADQQTHCLPSDETGRLRLALMMGYADWKSYFAQLEMHRDRVRAHFDEMITPPTMRGRVDDATRLARFQLWWFGELPDSQMASMLIKIDEDARRTALEAVAAFRRNVDQKRPSAVSRDRLDRLMPLLLSRCVEHAATDVVLLRVLPVIMQILRRSAYLLFLLEHPMALDRLVGLCASSPWLAEYLMKFPILLDELLDESENLATSDVMILTNTLRQQLMRVPENDLESQMEILRQFKNAYVFHVAVAEIEHRLPLKDVSNCLTSVAQVVIQAAFDIAAQQLSERLSLSQETIDALLKEHYLIVAFGKMGSYEMGYGSDVDLIFLHDVDSAERISPEHSLEKGVFFTRLTHRLIHILSTTTHSGRLYETDTRLRPAGDSGLLVNSFRYFQQYLMQEAWTWEHQAMVRARPVMGSPRLQEQFGVIRRDLLCQYRSREALKKDVAAMRLKMLEHFSTDGMACFDIKQDPGGVVDIEFIAQFGVLLWSHTNPEITRFTDTVRLLNALVEIGKLPQEDATLLTQAYLDFRATTHALVLQGQKPLLAAYDFATQRARVRWIWEKFLMQ